MLIFDKTKSAKEDFYGPKKKTKIWDVDVYNTIISKLIETKINSKCLIGYLDEAIITLFLILPKVNGYVKTFKDKNN